MDIHEMRLPEPRFLEIDEESLGTPAQLHERIARCLSFPGYYGANLSALSDCLEDVDEPTCIIAYRAAPAHRRDWFDGFCNVFSRTAHENPDLEFILHAPQMPGATLDDVLVRLERIEHRLDAMPAFGEAPAESVAPIAKVASDTCRNKASGADGDRFICGTCGCRVSDYLEDTRLLIDGLKYCPNCGREVTNPSGANALGWVGELI